MIKNLKILIYLHILLFSKIILASSSSSFLISQSAFNNYDFAQVISEYSSNQKNLDFKNDYLDELISAIVTENTNLAEKIAKTVLLKDPNNQEAKLVLMAIAFEKNHLDELYKLRIDESKTKNDLFEFLFFSEKRN